MIDSDFWRGRRVLITGHTGFKGAWLSLWLQRLGAEVTGFGGRSPSGPGPETIFSQAKVADGLADSLAGDVRDPAAVDSAVKRARPEIVLHLAALAHVRGSLRDPTETYATNVMGTVHLLDAVRRLGPDVRAVVSVTSDKCYDDREWEWPARESDPLGGRDPYSSSKACQEMVTAAFRDSLFAGRDIRVATARAGNVIGGGDWAQDRLVPDFVRAALGGTPLQVRAPEAVRPWLHVLNPLSGYLQLAQGLCGRHGQALATAWNFGPADVDRRSVRWVVEYLQEQWPVEVQTRFGTGESRETSVTQLDSSRARLHLGWAPPWDLATGLNATVEWYLRQRDGEDVRSLCEAQIRIQTDPAPGLRDRSATFA